MQEMELAFREGLESEPELEARIRRPALKFVLKAATLTFLVPLIGNVLSLGLAVLAAAVVSAVMIFWLIWMRRARSIGHLVSWFFLPVVFVFTSAAVFSQIDARSQTLLVLLPLSFIAVLTAGILPLTFYRAWLLTHPRLRIVTRRKESRFFPTGIGASFCYLVFVLGIMWSGAGISPSGALLLLLLLALLVGGSPLKTARLGLRLLAHYLTYTGKTTGAPGVWRAKLSVHLRKRLLGSTVVIFFFMMNISFHFFTPGDALLVLRSGWRRDGPAQVFDRSQALREATRVISPLGERGPGSSLSYRARASNIFPSTYAPMRAAFTDAAHLNAGAWLLLLLAVPLALVVPAITLLGFYGGPLRELEELRRRLEENIGDKALDDDDRTEWEWYVDRIRNSKHQAAL